MCCKVKLPLAGFFWVEKFHLELCALGSRLMWLELCNKTSSFLPWIWRPFLSEMFSALCVGLPSASYYISNMPYIHIQRGGCLEKKQCAILLWYIIQVEEPIICGILVYSSGGRSKRAPQKLTSLKKPRHRRAGKRENKWNLQGASYGY